MKPINFDYAAPETVAEAIRLLADAGGDGKLLAGGQSLIPLLNMRLARPSLLVDLGRIPGLVGVQVRDGWLHIGAMTPHTLVESDPLVRQHAPLLAEATALVGHSQIRHRGTIGGSTVHADPAAEAPLALVALAAELTAEGPDGRVTWPADQFFLGPMFTAIGEGQVLIEIRVPCQGPGEGWAVEEVSRRRGDFALVAVAVWLRREGDVCRDVRISLGGVADTPARATTAETALRGKAWQPELPAQSALLLDHEIDPPSDVHAPAAYRRSVVRELFIRALVQAWARAGCAS